MPSRQWVQLSPFLPPADVTERSVGVRLTRRDLRLTEPLDAIGAVTGAGERGGERGRGREGGMS